MDKTSNQSGLTLAELLIAMVIGSMVLALLAQALGNMSNWSNRLSHSRQTIESDSNLLRFIQERLNRIEPISILFDDEKQVLFQGSPSELRIVIAETTYPAIPGLYEQKLSVFLDEDQSWNLSLSRLPLTRLDNFGVRPMNDELILYTGTSQPQFSYFDGRDWQKKWPVSSDMPQQIGFSLTGWPELIIGLPRALAPISLENDPDETSGARDAIPGGREVKPDAK